MSADIASSSSLPEFPPEIWLKIFRLATFTPLETDVSVTKVEPGLFHSTDGCQSRAFREVLPLRRTIVQVSRRFYQIGIEVLYTAFHIYAGRIIDPNRRLLLFSDLLVSRPDLGRFVKRLSLLWSDRDEERNYRIISRCPNVMIFSSFLIPNCIGDRPWWGRGLPKTIRSLDAQVHKVPTNEVLAVLEMLPSLEVLHLLSPSFYTIPHTPVCLSALRILNIGGMAPGPAISSYPSVLSAMQLPNLTTLATSMGDIHAKHAFPLEALRRLEYFQGEAAESFRGCHSDYFDNLRYLEIIMGWEGLQGCLTYFPFHQLECLTVDAYYVSSIDWPLTVGRAVEVPLDAKAMPRLKLFQLILGGTGIYGHYHEVVDSTRDGEDFIKYFDTLVRRFEERNVLFVETNKREICPGFQPVCDALVACKKDLECRVEQAQE